MSHRLCGTEGYLFLYMTKNQELERYKAGFGKDGVGFECKLENFLTGTVNLRDAQTFITDILSNDKQV